MNWGDFKKGVKNLGFEESFDTEQITVATNRALVLISTLEPKEKTYTVTGNATTYTELDLTTITDYSSKSNKLPHLLNVPLASAYYVVDTMYIPNVEGNVTVFYNAIRTKITSDLDTTEIDLKDELIPFLELLTAWYMWLDDDERKATSYYNQFQEAYSQYKQNTYFEQPKVRVVGGIDL